ncbi:MAG: DNA repair protein RadA [Eubacteriales bacterium]|nr:DNA repair protein RadA [Eubacteriales bacterium]
MRERSKTESVFFCGECGFESKKWMGQCPSCHKWNTFCEEPVIKTTGSGRAGNRSQGTGMAKPVRLSEIDAAGETRYDTGFRELSRVLGGGIVPGSLVLVGGDPGIGKSTLLLQLAVNLSEAGRKVIYISGEESLKQIKLRADRIGQTDGDLGFLSETNISTVTALLEREKPDFAVIDSIQTMYTDEAQSAPGSVTQVRECAQALMLCAKQNNVAIFLVGHVTKEGTVAGPRVLEHIVDTVLYFESGDGGAYRILRSAKNRFGSTNEIGVFEMASDGLHEVENPSELMLAGRPTDASGAVVTCLMEGTRSMLMEVQGLVTETSFGMPRRQASGMDYNRLNLLLAVLEKRAGLQMSRYDAYVNIAGGMKVTEPALDLAVLAAILSSYRGIVVEADTIVFGEVGLSGEVRAVTQAEERIREAAKLGFSRVILPQYNLSRLKGSETTQISLRGIRNIGELSALLREDA